VTVTPQMQLAAYFFALIILPALLVAFSNIEPEARRRWVIIQMVFSWFGFMAFLIMLTFRQLRSGTDGAAD
jgi:hypothetical protein